jgi:hypothetical protein
MNLLEANLEKSFKSGVLCDLQLNNGFEQKSSEASAPTTSGNTGQTTETK